MKMAEREKRASEHCVILCCNVLSCVAMCSFGGKIGPCFGVMINNNYPRGHSLIWLYFLSLVRMIEEGGERGYLKS